MKVKDITQIGLMVALIIVLGFIPGISVAFLPVPIVLQNFSILLVSLLLGAKRGTIAVAIFLLLAAIGLPVLSGFRGGIITVLGPTGGYLLAWLLTPVVLSGIIYLIRKILNKALNFGWLYIASLITMIGMTYPVGSIWLHLETKMPFWTALSSNFIFVPGELIKCLVAVLIFQRLHKISLFAK